MFVSGLRGRVSVEVLPPGHGLAIERARVSLFYPAASIVMGDPWVEEAGWDVAHVPGGVQASRNSNLKIKYAEGYQRVFPQVTGELA